MHGGAPRSLTPDEAIISLDMSHSMKAWVGVGATNIRAKNIRAIGFRTGHRYFKTIGPTYNLVVRPGQ